MLGHINVPYKGNLMDGLFQRIQNETKIEDIVEGKYISFTVNSTREDSKPPKAIIEIDNKNYAKYWCAKNNDTSPIIISFRYPYLVQISGISLIFNQMDLFQYYHIETSMDRMIWDSSASFDASQYSIKEYPSGAKRWEHYITLDNLKPARFIRMYPEGQYGEYSFQVNTLAIYGMELFGEMFTFFVVRCTNNFLNLYNFAHLPFFFVSIIC